MSFTAEQIQEIHGRTDGLCHICRSKLRLSKYGEVGVAGAWEIDHSNPRARGGTDRMSNLLPACPSCNRSKGTKSTRAARAKHGHTAKPMSREAKNVRNGNVAGLGSLGLVIGAFAGGPFGALLGAAVGIALGDGVSPK